MAAAILMMNMHGAVMASDCDRTIFRYSEKIPFAIMVDPLSRLPWENIVMDYQAKKSINSKTSFEDCAEDFANYLTNIFNGESKNVINEEYGKKVVCVGFDNKSMYPRITVLTMHEEKNGIKMEEDTYEISINNPVFYQYLGHCPNIRILTGGMSDDINEPLFKLFVTELRTVIGNNKDVNELFSQGCDNLCNSFDNIQNDPQVTSAISDFTIKDMVALAENLIDTESLQHSRTDNYKPSHTCEIGIVTMAEGFKWIKHSLYGA